MVVSGTEQTDDLKGIISEQVTLIEAMKLLESKFIALNTVWDRELAEQLNALFHLSITEEDLKVFSGDRNLKIKETKSGKKDILIERLQDALTKPTMTQEDVCNLLSNDLYEKEKLANQMAN